MNPFPVIILSLLLPVLTATGSPSDPATLNKQGVGAFNRKDYRAALNSFIDAVKLAPGERTAASNLVAACRSLAGTSAARAEWERAAAVLREGLSALPGNTELRGDLVIVFVNQGTAALASHELSRAQKAAAEALQLDGSSAATNMLAGDIAYTQHDLAAARSSWERALAARPADPSISDRISRLSKELGSEHAYSKTNAYSFDIRFDYKALGNGIIDLRGFLMQAYEKAGREFDRFPEYPIVVILSDVQTFRMVNNMPAWVAGLYDGKIRVPVDFARMPPSTLKAVIFHEYTHALANDLSGGNCPVWLNEGMAMHEMENPSLIATDLLRRAVATGATLPLEQLADVATWRNPALVNLAYAQSWIMVEYLLSRWSGSQMKKLLSRFKQGATFSAILRDDMNRTSAQFELEWLAYARSR